MNQHKISVQSASIKSGSDTITINANAITMMMITHDYDGRRSPIFEIDLNVSNEVAKKIFSNDGKNRMSIELQEITKNGNETLGKRLFLKKTFDVIISSEMSDFRINAKPADAEKARKDVDQVRPLKLHLYDNKSIVAMSKSLSFNARSSTMATVLSYLITGRDLTNVVASPPANNLVYKDVPLPPGDLIQSIDYLNNEYGVYNSDVVVYQDFDYLYVLDKSNPNIIMKEQNQYGTVIFKIFDKENVVNVMHGSKDDVKEKLHVVNMSDLPDIKKFDEYYLNLTDYSTLMAVERGTGKVRKLTLDSKVPKMKVIETSNDLAISQFKNRLKGNRIEMAAIANECSMSIFRPYKDYKFIPDGDYAKYGVPNTLRLSYIKHIISADGGTFNVSSEIKLKSR